MAFRSMSLALGVVLLAAPAAAQAAPGVRTALEQALPGLSPDSLRVVVLEVRYPPGGASRPHVHPCAVIGHVTTGRLRVRIGQGEPVVFGAGESFYEPRGESHLESANASAVEPAVLVAIFVCDRALPLSTPIDR